MLRRLATALIVLPLLAVASGFALDWHRVAEPTVEGALCLACAPQHDHHDHHDHDCDSHGSKPAHHDHDCRVCHLILTALAGVVLDAPVVIAIAEQPTFADPADDSRPLTQLHHRSANPRGPPAC